MKGKKSIIIFLGVFSILLIAGGVFLYLTFDTSTLSMITQLISAIAASLAALWFTLGLWFQSKQLEDQKQQFLESYHYMRQDSRRDALIFCSDLLEKTKDKIIAEAENVKGLSDLVGYYTQMQEMAVMLKSNSFEEVLQYGNIWIKKEVPVLTLIRNLNLSATIYFDSIGVKYELKKEPEVFFLTYQKYIEDVPIFQEYYGPTKMLSEMIFRFSPARRSAQFAYEIALSLSTEKSFLKIDYLKDQHATFVKDDCPLPEIWNAFSEKYGIS